MQFFIPTTIFAFFLSCLGRKDYAAKNRKICLRILKCSTKSAVCLSLVTLLSFFWYSLESFSPGKRVDSSRAGKSSLRPRKCDIARWSWSGWICRIAMSCRCWKRVNELGFDEFEHYRSVLAFPMASMIGLLASTLSSMPFTPFLLPAIDARYLQTKCLSFERKYDWLNSIKFKIWIKMNLN